MLNKKIKIFLESKGIKFTVVASAIGMSNVTFSALINGNRKISAEEYVNICRFLGVPLEHFFKDVA